MWTIVDKHIELVGKCNDKGEYYLGAIHCRSSGSIRLIFGLKPDGKFEVSDYFTINNWVYDYRIQMEKLALALSPNYQSEYTQFYSDFEHIVIVEEKIKSIEKHWQKLTLGEVVNNLSRELQ